MTLVAGLTIAGDKGPRDSSIGDMILPVLRGEREVPRGRELGRLWVMYLSRTVLNFDVNASSL